MDKGNILNLRPKTRDDFELGFGAAVGLGLVECFLRDFLGEHSGGLGALEDTVLTQGDEGFEDVLADREAEDELPPGKQGTIKVSRKALIGRKGDFELVR